MKEYFAKYIFKLISSVVKQSHLYLLSRQQWQVIPEQPEFSVSEPFLHSTRQPSKQRLFWHGCDIVCVWNYTRCLATVSTSFIQYKSISYEIRVIACISAVSIINFLLPNLLLFQVSKNFKDVSIIYFVEFKMI